MDPTDLRYIERAVDSGSESDGGFSPRSARGNGAESSRGYSETIYHTAMDDMSTPRDAAAAALAAAPGAAGPPAGGPAGRQEFETSAPDWLADWRLKLSLSSMVRSCVTRLLAWRSLDWPGDSNVNSLF